MGTNFFNPFFWANWVYWVILIVLWRACRRKQGFCNMSAAAAAAARSSSNLQQQQQQTTANCKPVCSSKSSIALPKAVKWEHERASYHWSQDQQEYWPVLVCVGLKLRLCQRSALNFQTLNPFLWFQFGPTMNLETNFLWITHWENSLLIRCKEVKFPEQWRIQSGLNRSQMMKSSPTCRSWCTPVKKVERQSLRRFSNLYRWIW